jgi:hypothetical protein
MKATVVRYEAKPERADENQELIETVFAELDEREPQGFTYQAFRLADGVSFIHVVIEHDVESPDSLQAVPAFQAFVAGIADRCVAASGRTPDGRRNRIRLRSICARPRPLSPGGLRALRGRIAPARSRGCSTAGRRSPRIG